MPKVYFKNLDGLRFVAAMLVILHHCDTIRAGRAQPDASMYLPQLDDMGNRGVNLFFVLSGFLITYLLTDEHAKTGTIQVKRFYIKRALRIWPVYFFVVALTFGVFPHIDYLRVWEGYPSYFPGFAGQLLPYYLLFSVHIAAALYPALPFGGILWSVSVEEQFYLLWPWILLALSKIKWLVFLALIYLSYKGKAILWAKTQGGDDKTAWPNVAYNILEQTRIELFAFGALAAFLLYRHRNQLARWFFAWPAQLFTWVFFIYVAFSDPVLFPWISLKQGLILKPFFQTERILLEGLSYALMILTLAANPRCWISLESPWLKHLGQISYGLYAYNWIVISIIVQLWLDFLPNPYRITERGTLPALAYHLIFMSMCTVATVAVSEISFRYLESPFLRLKKRLDSDAAGI